jgi:hypothetical protein
MGLQPGAVPENSRRVEREAFRAYGAEGKTKPPKAAEQTHTMAENRPPRLLFSRRNLPLSGKARRFRETQRQYNMNSIDLFSLLEQ